MLGSFSSSSKGTEITRLQFRESNTSKTLIIQWIMLWIETQNLGTLWADKIAQLCFISKFPATSIQDGDI